MKKTKRIIRVHSIEELNTLLEKDNFELYDKGKEEVFYVAEITTKNNPPSQLDEPPVSA
jgi:hypothetical protein